MRMTYVVCFVLFLFWVLGYAWPLGETLESVVGYGFSHYSGLHLAMNLLGVLTVGLGVERARGHWAMLLVFVLGVIYGGITHYLFGPALPVVGASAGVYALLGAYAMHYPTKRVVIVVFPMRALTAISLLMSVEVFMALAGYLPGIAHWAHIGGLSVGLLLELTFKNNDYEPL